MAKYENLYAYGGKILFLHRMDRSVRNELLISGFRDIIICPSVF
jgi:hypothetical protein